MRDRMVSLSAKAVIQTLIEVAVLFGLAGGAFGYLLRGWLS